jgi:glycogen phosphorylase
MKEILSEVSDVMQQAVTQQTEENYRNDFNLTRELPTDLEPLRTISENFAWSWLGGTDVFRDLEPALWQQCEQNPRELLKRVSELRLWQCSADAEYVRRVENFKERLDRYLASEPEPDGIVTREHPAAYFCAEFGIHNSLPIYSGGLGILAGDHLKSASDLNIPLVAVGLFYRYGYFRQAIGHDGWQNERYPDLFESELALSPVFDENGERIKVVGNLRGRAVTAQAWLVKVGRISLYLLDTNLPENPEVDRLITGHLYGGGNETRIVQEKVLGIGGVRLLRKLGIDPSVFHLNEGHSAFLALELAREYLSNFQDASFDDAVSAVKQKCVFTTHTPVEAGNDAFSPDDLRECFAPGFLETLKISEPEFFALGRTNPADEQEYFGMTPFAIRMTRSANGVSRKHGDVSRGLWHKMFSTDTPVEQVPITSVTNGVHAPTWISPVLKNLFENHIGQDWKELLNDQAAWQSAVTNIPEQDFWQARKILKCLLISFIRQRLLTADVGAKETINEHKDTLGLFSPDVLTIGFARRVAAYKRWNLILSDVDRLLRMVDDSERPVQFVFAGKAHPQDLTAKEILQRLMSINHDSKWQSRAVFLPDYDQEVAKYLVHGVDIWMNVPRRPLEASGTSGMKAAMNGVLNFSILDGWWIEGYNGENGFAIGDRNDDGDAAENDERDAESFYSTLEQQMIPAFYNKGESGLPHEWIRRSKDAIATLTPEFSTDRMVREYLERIYNPG